MSSSGSWIGAISSSIGSPVRMAKVGSHSSGLGVLPDFPDGSHAEWFLAPGITNSYLGLLLTFFYHIETRGVASPGTMHYRPLEKGVFPELRVLDAFRASVEKRSGSIGQLECPPH